MPTWSELARPSFRVRVSNPLLGAPVDRALDRVGVRPQDHDGLPHPGLGHAIQDVLEQRLAGELREQLPPTEPRPRAGSQDERRDPHCHARIFAPGCRAAGPSGRGGRPFQGRGGRPFRSRARALAHRDATPPVPLGDDLGEDREGGLGRRATTEVETDRSAQLCQLVRRQPGLLQPRTPIRLRLAGPDRADVPAAPAKGGRRSPARRT